MPFIILETAPVDLTPNKKLVKFNYVIGSKFPLINLLQYYNVMKTSKFEITFNAKQISGNTITNFTIDKSNQFTFYVNYESFA